MKRLPLLLLAVLAAGCAYLPNIPWPLPTPSPSPTPEPTCEAPQERGPWCSGGEKPCWQTSSARANDCTWVCVNGGHASAPCPPPEGEVCTGEEHWSRPDSPECGCWYGGVDPSTRNSVWLRRECPTPEPTPTPLPHDGPRCAWAQLHDECWDLPPGAGGWLWACEGAQVRVPDKADCPPPPPTPPPSPTPPPPGDGWGTCACPALVRWGTNMSTAVWTSPNGARVDGPVVGGAVHFDSTPRFGSGNGQACNDAHHHAPCDCGNGTWARCEPPSAPEWSLSGPGELKVQGEWGYQAKVALRARGRYVLRVCARPGMVDQLGRPLRTDGAACSTLQWDVP